MAGNGNQKLKLLYLLQILESETDEENPIKTADILRRLSDLGIVAERKSIYRDIDCLREAGYDIVSASGGGYFLGRDIVDTLAHGIYIHHATSCKQ